MSIIAVGIVLDAPIRPSTTKLVAVALANWCNDDGRSLYPSMTMIANKAGISRCQARRIVHGLIAVGLLSVVANGSGGKPGDTPHYRLHLDRIRQLAETGSTDATASTDAQDGSHGCTGGIASMHKRGRMGATQTVREPSENRHSSASATEKATSKASRPKLETEHPLFGEFYAAYPRKVDRQDAVKAFATLNPDRTLLDTMLAAIKAQGLARRCADGEGRFVPHPATWINRRRWEDQIGAGVLDLGAAADPRPSWLDGTGFPDVFAAENAGCGPGNAARFRNCELVIA
jgi:hypothetical protein